MARPCILNRAQYTEAASKVTMKLVITYADGSVQEIEVPFKEGRGEEQSLGFGINEKMDLPMGGKAVQHMVNLQVTATGTKNRG